MLRTLRVAELADGGQRYTGHAYLDAVATARADGVPVIAPHPGIRKAGRVSLPVPLSFSG
ncbi:MAG TPA: hypothetical protein VMV82_06915 [Candidatus Dormibacteraeota bacterium]|nr:hypothetical protein [Candidatus Dormibacteraeota bacterium]